MKYSLQIAHLYGDLMNTYGDIGNIYALQYYGKFMDTEIIPQLISLNDTFNADDFDLVLFGGGQDFEQKVVSKDLLKKSSQITKFIENNGVFLGVCGGFQLIGKYYVTAEGEKVMGSGSLDHYTLNQNENRFIGNTIIEDPITHNKYHGFENHQGMTFLGKKGTSLGKVLEGYGNNGKDKTEGVHYKNTYGTYFHGPILTRNPKLAQELLIQALKNHYPNIDFNNFEKLSFPPTF